VTTDEILARVRGQGIVTLEVAEWARIQGAFQEVERHATFIAGDLVIARDGDGLVAVEEPSPARRVIRRLAPQEVRAFVQDRLDTYERMWDGCGCKVEYYR
jgi:hypothetical protein